METEMPEQTIDEKKTKETATARTKKLESLVTADQVLSASVARKRRSKRVQNTSHNTTTSPVSSEPSTPVDKGTNTGTKPATPSRPTRRRSRESKETIEVKDVKENKVNKQEPSPEVVDLLNKARRSLSSDRHARKLERRGDHKAIIKRSQSTPREPTASAIDDEDLIKSFRKAQRLSAEVGTSPTPYYTTSTSEEEDEDYTSTDEETRQEEEARRKEKLRIEEQQRKKDLLKEKEVLKEKLKLIHQANQKTEKPLKKPTAAHVNTHASLSQKLLVWRQWKQFVLSNPEEYSRISRLCNRCVCHIIILLIVCGLGGFIFRFTEGAFESFYKCGVKRVKRDFVDTLWLASHNMREDDWKSLARRKLMDFEEQLHTAHEAGMHSYSGQRAWSFLNAVVYCLTVVTTIGYGHITPATATGRAITIIYAIFGIPMFLILLADFGKLFTRCIKFVWAFVRRLYYTGSCRKVRRTETVQDVMKGVQMVYEIATFRRPSQMNIEDIEIGDGERSPKPPMASPEGDLDIESPTTATATATAATTTPNTPAPSNFAVDDEFNLPVSVAIVILVIYLLSGASMYYLWENWSFFESFYFVFISMSTIGFGDFVPNHPMYMMASILYLVFGLALTSMCINVVQVKLSDTFRQASAKIGATIGLATPEDEPPAEEETTKKDTLHVEG